MKNFIGNIPNYLLVRKYNKKGKLIEQADADILILDKNMELSSVIARGQVMMQCGKLLKKGTYE